MFKSKKFFHLTKISSNRRPFPFLWMQILVTTFSHLSEISSRCHCTLVRITFGDELSRSTLDVYFDTRFQIGNLINLKQSSVNTLFFIIVIFRNKRIKPVVFFEMSEINLYFAICILQKKCVSYKQIDTRKRMLCECISRV